MFPLGQRRVYAVETAPLAALAHRLRELVETTEAHEGERDVIARYRAATDCALEPRAGGRAVLEYRDAEGRYRSEGQVHAAKKPEHLTFDLDDLEKTGEGDILVNSSASIPGSRPAGPPVPHDLPRITGNGQRLFDDGLPPTKWPLTNQETGELGETTMTNDREHR